MAEKAIWQRDLPSPEVTVEGQIFKFIYMTFVLEYFILDFLGSIRDSQQE
jgi:hypothetical protein